MTREVAITTSNKSRRIEVRVPPNTSPKQERELAAFARYCVLRIEKDLGERQQWVVEIVIGSRGYAAHVEVQDIGVSIEMRGIGDDGPLAIWDAICRIEQELRDCRTFLSTRVANDN